jgi:hypothetical protein
MITKVQQMQLEGYRSLTSFSKAIVEADAKVLRQEEFRP